MTQQTNRQRLHSAQCERDGALREVQAAEGAVAGAISAIAEAEQAVASVTGDARKQAVWAARSFGGHARTAVTNPEHSPARMVAVAEAQLVAAQGAHADLRGELATARAELVACENQVHALAVAVVNEVADAIAAELITHRERAAELQHQLEGLCLVPKGGPANFSTWPGTPILLKALAWSEQQYAGNLDPVKIAKSKWTQFRDMLVSDPAAVFNGTYSNSTVPAIGGARTQ